MAAMRYRCITDRSERSPVSTSHEDADRWAAGMAKRGRRVYVYAATSISQRGATYYRGAELVGRWEPVAGRKGKSA